MSIINYYRLIRDIRKKGVKRHPMYEKSKAMKIFMYIMVGFWAVYLAFFGVLMARAMADDSREAYDTINGGMIVFLIIDYLMRYTMQETPAQMIRPFKTLPIKENFLHNVFLVRIGMSAYNLFWLCYFLPFGLISIAFSHHLGFLNLLGYLIGVWLLFVLNGYWYLFWRTLVNHHFVWHAAPLVIYAAIVWFGMIDGDWAFYGQMRFVRGFIVWNPLTFLAMALAIALAFFVNRYFQKKAVYREISRRETVKKVKTQQMSFLDRYGEVGGYLKLEIKSIMRNPVVRKSFLSGLFATLMLCTLHAFTDAYGGFMRSFICVYCFAAMSIINLTNVMGVEGNYIDGLMSRKESVLSLLKAKYYFNIMLMVLPLLFCILPVVEGKMDVIEVLGCLLFSIGVIMPCVFQMAVYNTTTLNLVEKMQGGTNNTKVQMVVSLAALFVPMIVMYVLIVCFSTMVAGTIMSVMGLAGMMLSPWWLRNIYERFMLRRYENMSSFRASR